MSTRARRSLRYIGAATAIAVPAATINAGAPDKSITASVPGAKAGDVVDFTLAAPTDNIVVDAYVSAPSTVTLRFHSVSGNPTRTATTASVTCFRMI